MASMPLLDVIVAGAGLGGLAAASILARKGKRVLVLERHSIPGGYATNFERKGFTFDVSLHSFDGVCEGGPSYEIVKACGVGDRVEFLPHRKLYRVLAHDIDLSVEERNEERYQQQLAALFPEEREGLRRMFKEAARMHEHVGRFFCLSLPFPLKMMAMPFLFHRILKYERYTVDQFFSQFIHNERLKEILAVQWTYYGLPPDRMGFPHFSYPFIDYLRHGGYSIKGGSQKLSNALVDVIRENGGEVHLTTPVQEILIENGRVVGVKAKRLGELRARTVISNLSPQTTIKLADEKHFPADFLRKLSEMKVAISGLQVYLGLDCSLKELGLDPDEYILFCGCKAPLTKQYEAMQANQLSPETTGFSINIFSAIDPSMAPPGKSSMGLFSLCGGDYWHTCPRPEYELRKKAVTEMLLQRAEHVIPGLGKHVEICETATPRTMTRYTGNPSGSFYGFEQSVAQCGMRHRFPQRYPVKGLYQVGAWTFPGGGFIAALMSAKFLVDRYF